MLKQRQTSKSAKNSNNNTGSSGADGEAKGSSPWSSNENLSQDKNDIKVNLVNMTELKNACDDAVKEFFAKPDCFKPSHVHTDVKLCLGWISIVVAILTSLYGYQTPFEESKFWVTVGVSLYVLINGFLNVYAYYIVKDTIFVGRRKTFSGRIETEHLTVSSTVPPHNPTYKLKISYVHSSNGGKSLIKKADTSLEKPFSDFFDVDGKFSQPRLANLLNSMLDQVQGSGSSSSS